MQPETGSKRLWRAGLALVALTAMAGCASRDRPDRDPAAITISRPAGEQSVEEAEATAERICEQVGEEEALLQEDFAVQEGDVRVATFDCVEDE